MPDNNLLYDPALPKKGSYTYKVMVSFNVEYSFNESEVEEDPEGKIGADFNPTPAALHKLRQQLRDELVNFSVSNIEAHAESDELIGFEPL